MYHSICMYNRTTHVTYHININLKIMHIIAKYELTKLYPPNIHIICSGEQQRLTRVCASAKSSDNVKIPSVHCNNIDIFYFALFEGSLLQPG